MVISESMGDETCQANWHEKGENGNRAQDRRDPSLHLGRWDFIRVWHDEGGLKQTFKFLAWFNGPAMSRWDGGCGDLVE
jgi:hypothetical protein